jgi:FixJ family two-component response regulator
VDLTLPGSSGSDVLRRLAAADCRAKVIVYSGAGAAELAAAQDEARQLGLNVAGGLAKPFTLARLRVLLNGTS